MQTSKTADHIAARYADKSVRVREIPVNNRNTKKRGHGLGFFSPICNTISVTNITANFSRSGWIKFEC